MRYRIGWPCWRLLGRMGVPLYYRIIIVHSDLPGVWAYSPDIRLTAYGSNRDELISEVRSSALDLLEGEITREPDIEFKDI